MTTRFKKLRASAKKIWKKSDLKDAKGENKLTFAQFWRRTKDNAISDTGSDDFQNMSASAIKKAARKTAHSETYVSASQRSRENIIHSLRTKFKDSFQEIKKLNREFRTKKGTFTSLKGNLVWSKEYNTYVLGGKYIIDVHNSPEEVNIIDIADIEGEYNAGQR